MTKFFSFYILMISFCCISCSDDDEDSLPVYNGQEMIEAAPEGDIFIIKDKNYKIWGIESIYVQDYQHLTLQEIYRMLYIDATSSNVTIEKNGILINYDGCNFYQSFSENHYAMRCDLAKNKTGQDRTFIITMSYMNDTRRIIIHQDPTKTDK